MNWTNRVIDHTSKIHSTTKQSNQSKYYHTSNVELLCNEIETLARDSKTLEIQYKAIVDHYHNLARQAIA